MPVKGEDKLSVDYYMRCISGSEAYSRDRYFQSSFFFCKGLNIDQVQVLEKYIIYHNSHTRISWRNEKATFKEKKIEIATEKMPGHDHEADHIFIGLPTDKCKL